MTDKKPTKSERRDEAKQRRLEEMRRRQRAARTRKLVTWIVVAVVVAGAGVGIYLAASKSSKPDPKLQELAAAAGCTLQDFKDQGQTHITPPATIKYNSTPPTSGSHYPSPDQTGVHPAQIQDETQVHNLEHGHVIIHYNGTSDEFTTKLEALAKVDDTRVIVEPYKTMQYKVAMTAWTHLGGCPNATNEDAVLALARAFIKKYKGKGPEGDLPGTPAA